MEDDLLLRSIVIIFALSIGVIMVCDRLRLPTIVGFLLTGIICGPHGLGLIRHLSEVRELAEIGVVLLLFKIGMKLSIARILEFKRFFFLGGALQVLFTALAGYGIGRFIGRPVGESIFLGFLLSLSSTAIVLKILEDRLESSSPQGKVMLGILIFQDIAAVLMMILTPYLSEEKFALLDASVLITLGEGLLMLGIVFVSAERIVPRFLYSIAKTRHKELFFISILAICFGVAWVASLLGLSLSLGAFLAGLIIAESEYSLEAIGGIIPSQEVFTSFFFVSIGMLFDLSFVVAHPIVTFLVAFAILAMKSVIIFFVTILLGMPLRTAIIAGIGLAQVGEFSFVLLRFGMDAGIGTPYHYQLFLAVSVLTLALTPSLIHLAYPIAHWALQFPFPARLKAGYSPLAPMTAEEELKDHVIICGFGVNGRHLANALKDAGIPYTILEMNAKTVREERKKGQPIHFGDASHETVLEHVNIAEARVLVATVNDPLATQHIVRHARHLNPKVDIIARTQYLSQMEQMFRIGANEVIPDEFGSSIEIFANVLRKYDVPDERIEKSISEFREEGYRMVRQLFHAH